MVYRDIIVMVHMDISMSTMPWDSFYGVYGYNRDGVYGYNCDGVYGYNRIYKTMGFLWCIWI